MEGGLGVVESGREETWAFTEIDRRGPLRARAGGRKGSGTRECTAGQRGTNVAEEGQGLVQMRNRNHLEVRERLAQGHIPYSVVLVPQTNVCFMLICL